MYLCICSLFILVTLTHINHQRVVSCYHTIFSCVDAMPLLVLICEDELATFLRSNVDWLRRREMVALEVPFLLLLPELFAC
jgi:hypothetical protein